MNFLSPAFLFGALAVAAPILFHLIRRTTREVKPFSSLMFLRPTPPRVTSRSRLENLWLLLLRCLVLLALALGFARPFFRNHSIESAGSSGAGRHVVLLIDTSASMRRDGLWKQALAKAGAVLDSATPEDVFTVATFDRAPRTILTSNAWEDQSPPNRVQSAKDRLAGISPGWGGTDLGAAAQMALGALDEVGKAKARTPEIVIISDLQEGSRMEALQAIEWPKEVHVKFEPVASRAASNASIQWLSGGESQDLVWKNEAMRIRVTNAPDAKKEMFRMTSDGEKGGGQDVYVPAGQSRVMNIPSPSDGSQKLSLTGDEERFDNEIWLLAPKPRRIPILFLGNDANDDSKQALFYLLRAFKDTAGEAYEISAYPSEKALPTFVLQQAKLLVIGNGASDAQMSAARNFAHDGRMVLVALESVESAGPLRKILGIADLRITEDASREYSLLAQIDFRHPVFAPFADPRFSDFTKIHFWNHRRVDAAEIPGARVLASFDNRDPAVIHVPMGEGGVMVFTSSWRPADSQLALSTKFLPLMNAIAEESAGLPPAHAQYFVGDEVTMPPSVSALTAEMPDGTSANTGGGGKFSATTQPGIYAVEPGGHRFVVNLDPEESRLAPVPPDRFAALGVPLTPVLLSQPQYESAVERAKSADAEQKQKLWRWMVIAAVIILLAETVAAARLSTPRTSTGATP